MTYALTMMWLFTTGWLALSLQLSFWFTVLVGIVIVFELVATWVPLRGGWRYDVHQASSYGAAMLIPAVLAGIVLSPAVNGPASVVTVISIVAMIGLFLLYFFFKETHKHHLVYQSLYIVAFHVSILSVMFSA